MPAPFTAKRVATAMLIAAVLVLALIAGAVWFAASDAGLRWASGEATARSGGRLTIEGATGSLGGTVRIARLGYADENLSLVADDVAFTWSPRALLSRSVVVDALSASTLTLEFKPSAGPSAPPASLALPWPIDVRRAEIAALTVASGPNRWRVTRLGFHYTGAIDRHALDALALDSEWGSVRGRLAIAAKPPFAAEGSINFAGSDAARRAIATVTVGGNMTTLSLWRGKRRRCARNRRRARRTIRIARTTRLRAPDRKPRSRALRRSAAAYRIRGNGRGHRPRRWRRARHVDGQ